MKIKICGLTRPEDIMAVNQYLPDYIGFVFAPGRRQISTETASLLKAMLSPQIKSVGVFLNAPRDTILKLAAQRVIDVIQLHGDESEDYARFLEDNTSLPVIKAIRVKQTQDILDARNFPSTYLLLDTYVKGIYGGSGLSFDWTCIPPLEKPYFLAGGLTPQNLTEAMKTNAFCLDLSSSAETDGKKDPAKIKTIMKTIRSK